MSRAMEGLLAPSELFQRHCSRPVKIIIRVPRYTILPLAEGYAIFNPHLKILLKKLPVFLISILSLYTQEIM